MVCYTILLVCRHSSRVTLHFINRSWWPGRCATLSPSRESAVGTEFRQLVAALSHSPPRLLLGNDRAQQTQCQPMSSFCSEPLACLRFFQNCTAVWGSGLFLLSLCRSWAYLQPEGFSHAQPTPLYPSQAFLPINLCTSKPMLASSSQRTQMDDCVTRLFPYTSFKKLRPSSRYGFLYLFILHILGIFPCYYLFFKICL